MTETSTRGDPYRRLEETRHTLTLAEVEEYAGIRFPKGTHLLRAECLNFLEVELWAQLRMSETAYEQFVGLPQFVGKFSSSDRHEMTNRLALPPGGLSWWKPDEIRDFVSAEHTTREDRDWGDRRVWTRTAVLISGNPVEGTHTVYLYLNCWHE